MQLIGLLDSPYVRRVFISLRLMGIPFEHRAISVFRNLDEFRQINPVVKAPSFICDDGTVLMDSTLILEYIEGLDAGTRSLMPGAAAERQRALRVIGLALAACDKAVQIIYEQEQRPPEKQYAPWLQRVEGQVLAAWAGLEQEIKARSLAAARESIDQAGITTAVAWRFTQMDIPQIVKASDYPSVQRFVEAAERLPEFAAAPPR